MSKYGYFFYGFAFTGSEESISNTNRTTLKTISEPNEGKNRYEGTSFSLM